MLQILVSISRNNHNHNLKLRLRFELAFKFTFTSVSDFLASSEEQLSMAFVTEQQKEIILQNPLDRFLDDSREKLRNLHEDIESCQAHIARLFAALIKSSAAWSLRFQDEGSIIADQLFMLRKQIDESRIDLGKFGKLIRRVVDGSSDLLIWAEIFNFVDSLLPQTPPSSNRLSNSETRKVVEKEIFEEIKDCVYRNVGGFWDNHFTT